MKLEFLNFLNCILINLVMFVSFGAPYIQSNRPKTKTKKHMHIKKQWSCLFCDGTFPLIKSEGHKMNFFFGHTFMF